MSREAMLPCLVCGKVLRNAMPDTTNLPDGGTELRTYGHYGSTVWDSFNGEELILNVCDDCLRAHTDRLARQRRYRQVMCEGFVVGQEWLDHQMVPWFDGPEDDDVLTVEMAELGTDLGRVQWLPGLGKIKALIAAATA